MRNKTKQKLRDSRLLLLLIALAAAYFSGTMVAAMLLAVIICWYLVKSPVTSPVYIRRQTAALSGLAAILLLVLVATARLSLHEFIIDGGLLALAILPLQQLLVPQRRLPVSGVGPKLTLVSIGVMAQALFAVPLPISMFGLVLFDLLCTAIQRSPYHAAHQRHPVGLSVLAGGLSYGAFLLFFTRRGLSPVNIDPASHLYFAATTLSLAVMALCLLDPSLFKMNRRRFVASLAVLIAVLAMFGYLPWLQNSLHSGGLQPTDWLLAIGTTTVFYLAHGLHHHSRRHTRHALLRDHPLEALRKHPKLA